MMKILTVAALMISVLAAKAQTSIFYPDARVAKSTSPVIFIDSVKMDTTIGINYPGYLDPNEIANIVVNKNTPYVNGALYITLKNHQVLVALLADKLVSIGEISKTNIAEPDRKKPVLYFLDDKLLTDTTGIRIPSKRVNRVVVNKASEMPYLNAVFPGMVILRIFTKPEELYIRGQRKDMGHGLM